MTDPKVSTSCAESGFLHTSKQGILWWSGRWDDMEPCYLAEGLMGSWGGTEVSRSWPWCQSLGSNSKEWETFTWVAQFWKMSAAVLKLSYILENSSREMQIFGRFRKENWCQRMWPGELSKTEYLFFLLYFVFQIKMVVGYFKQLCLIIVILWPWWNELQVRLIRSLVMYSQPRCFL